MKKELEEKLLRKYPKLYRQYYWDMTQTAMNWGFCCGDGWYDIIDELSEKLSKFDVEAVQVKEKFGGLRFYLGPCDKEDWDEIYGYITDAELKSVETCEVCGKPGSIKGRGWLRCLCDECEKKEERVKELKNSSTIYDIMFGTEEDI
jgi:hypothetical protein